MPKARFDIPTQLPSGVTRPIYAGVGATDLVVEVFRETVADMQKRAQERAQSVRKELSTIDYEPQALRRQATHAVTAGVAGFQTEASHLPALLQKLVDEQVSGAGDTYADLVKRGELLVERIRRQSATEDAVSSAATTKAKAKTTRTQATKTAKKASTTAKRTARRSPASGSAKATVTSAAKTASSAAAAAGDAAQKLGD